MVTPSPTAHSSSLRPALALHTQHRAYITVLFGRRALHSLHPGLVPRRPFRAGIAGSGMDEIGYDVGAELEDGPRPPDGNSEVRRP
jgi:hypothetical protein